MGDSLGLNNTLNDSGGIELTGKIFMVVGIVFLFFVVVFSLFLHLYAKWFWYNREEEPTTTTTSASTTRRRRRFNFAPGHLELSNPTTALRRGLDPEVLKTIPIVIVDSKDFKDGLECAVCLSDLVSGEKARLLPKCNHGFHVDCIDMWFQSHSTCPLCRNPVSNSTQLSPELTLETILNSPRTESSAFGVYSAETPNFPTNVLFWGNQSQVNTLGSCLEEDHPCPASSQSHSSSSSSSLSSSTGNKPDGMLVIDIPMQTGEDEEVKSPVTTRLRSLKRLLSRDRRVNPFSTSVDAEEVHRGQC